MTGAEPGGIAVPDTPRPLTRVHSHPVALCPLLS